MTDNPVQTTDSTLNQPGSPGSPKPSLTQDQKLALFESILDEVEPQPNAPQTTPSALPQALPTALDPSFDQQAAQITPIARAGKEALETTTPDQPAIEAGTGLQAVETEKTPEIPVEVESYLQKVQDDPTTAPQEIVIADGTSESDKAQYPARPVIVLPITPDVERKGRWKGPQFSLRWLVEWSRKIIKMFAGKVVYRYGAS